MVEGDGKCEGQAIMWLKSRKIWEKTLPAPDNVSAWKHGVDGGCKVAARIVMVIKSIHFYKYKS